MTDDVLEDTEENLSADLDLFATFDNKRGWALAFLAARRVEPGEGNGVGFEQESTKWCARTTFRRLSAREFARRTGTSHKRVMAYLKAWARAAADGVVPAAHTLAPHVAVDLPDERKIPFFGEGGYYRGHETYEFSEERLERIEHEAQIAGIKPNSMAYVVAHPRAVTAAIIADEKAYKAAKKAFEEYDRRQAQADLEDREANQKIVAEQDLEVFDADGATAEEMLADTAQSELHVATLILQELTAVRRGAIRTLALLRDHSVVFTEEQGSAIAELCQTTRAALDFVHDLNTSCDTGLSDAALLAFLEESEKRG